MRIALVYDCLYPLTIGGAERWLRLLAEDLARDNEVTYVTRQLWEEGEDPIPGVRCVGVSAGGGLYTPEGRRRLEPAARFAGGVFGHFARSRREYDVVHCLSFPYLPLPALRTALAGPGSPAVFCEWLECLSAGWWRSYGGMVGGTAGRLLQALCVRATPEAFAFSGLVESRLEQAGLWGRIHRLPGLWLGGTEAPASSEEREPLVVIAGRHVPDKRVPVALDAFAAARASQPQLHAVVLGDGPRRRQVLERIQELGLQEVVDAPGTVSAAEVGRFFRRASCVLSASVREGYGMAVLEGAGAGAPVVICRSPDNASVELVENGVNGYVAEEPTPEALAEKVVQVVEEGEELRRSARDWFATRAAEVSATASIGRVREAYRAATFRYES